MTQLSLNIIHAGEKIHLPFIPQSNSSDSASQIFMASGKFGKVTCLEYQTALGRFQIIRLELSTEAILSYPLKAETVLLSYCIQGSFKFQTNGAKTHLIARSLGMIHYTDVPVTPLFTVGHTENKEYVVFNLVTSSTLPNPGFFAPIFPHLVERIKQIGSILLESEPFISSVDFQRNISEVTKELSKTFPDKMQLDAYGRLALLSATDLIEVASFPKDLEKEWNPEERMVFLLAESIILGMDESWSIKRLANSKQLNQNKVKILFKKYVGLPAAAFKISVRMKKAQQLIVDTPLSIQEISLQVGYSNPAHFSTLFKRKMGCSPSSIRKTKDYKGAPLRRE